MSGNEQTVLLPSLPGSEPPLNPRLWPPCPTLPVELLQSRRARLLAAALALTALLVLALSGAPFGDRGTRLFGEVASGLAAVAAAGGAAWARRRETGTARWGWAFLSAAAVAWLAGEVVWAIVNFGGATPAARTSSWAGAGFTTAVAVLMAAGATAICPYRGAARARAVLDGLLIAASLIFIGVVAAAMSVHGPAHTPGLALAPPMGDALAGSLLFLALSRAPDPERRSTLAVLGAGIFALGASDGLYALAVLSGSHQPGRELGAGWFGGFLLLAVAAVTAESKPRQPARPDRSEGPLQVAVPYLFLLAAVAAAAYYFARDDRPNPFIRWEGLAVIAIAAFGLIAHREALLSVVHQYRCAEAALQRQRSRLREAELRWELSFDRSPMGAALINPDGTFARCNQALADMLERPAEELTGASFSDLVPPSDSAVLDKLFADLLEGRRDRAVLERDFHRRRGGVLSAHIEVAVVRDDSGGLQSMVAQVQDVSERRRADDRQFYESLHDPLTGLPNSTFLDNQISELLRIGRPFGVAYCDLNRFKTVNDSLGRAAGDELLRAVAHRLAAGASGRCTVGRAIGDEFILVCLGATGHDDLAKLAGSVIATLANPFDVRGHQHALGVNVGVTASKPWHHHPDEVLREAHEAMLRAKGRGRGRVEVYDPAQDNPASVADLELENALRVSLSSGQGLKAYYQPILRLGDRTVAGHEALARWEHPEQGFLTPSSFLSLAEQTGLVVPLGWWMLDAACAALASGRGQGEGQEKGRGVARGGWIAVNVSGSQLGRGLLAPAISQAVAAHGLEPSQLHLEITETALVETTGAVRAELAHVAEMGVAIALDDFGTGYSSLSMLRELPVRAVKIDRSFVGPIGDDRTTAAIVHRLVQLCRDMGIDSIAEGIETDAQAELLERLGCTHGQGYRFGRPAAELYQPAG
ncbi:MAG TPA: EAL domain-containing protein [Acidimicrobiales bacterium]|nr:EAL domain-containing protein [Acidimicrobiales bacterium]